VIAHFVMGLTTIARVDALKQCQETAQQRF